MTCSGCTMSLPVKGGEGGVANRSTVGRFPLSLGKRRDEISCKMGFLVTWQVLGCSHCTSDSALGNGGDWFYVLTGLWNFRRVCVRSDRTWKKVYMSTKRLLGCHTALRTVSTTTCNSALSVWSICIHHLCWYDQNAIPADNDENRQGRHDLIIFLK